MRIRLQIDHRVIDLETGGSLYVEMTNWAFHASFDLKQNSWLPSWDRWRDGAGQIEFLGWQCVYNDIDRKFYGFTTAG